MLDVGDLGTILSVWAHPDDEGYCCGGLMAAAARNGQRVVCVTATRGELGSTDPDRWPPGPELAAVRTAELKASLAELGITEHHWLDYPDGGCADVDEAEAAARLTAIIADVRPDTILTFGPDGATYHPDHMAVSRWVSAAAQGTRVLHTAITPASNAALLSVVPAEMVMMADRPPVIVAEDECALALRLTGEALDQKFRAMLCQESQIGPVRALAGDDRYRAYLAFESFVEAKIGYADGGQHR